MRNGPPTRGVHFSRGSNFHGIPEVGSGFPIEGYGRKGVTQPPLIVGTSVQTRNAVVAAIKKQLFQ